MEAKTKNTKLNDDDLFTDCGSRLSNTHSCIEKTKFMASTERQAHCFYYHSGSNHWRVHFCRVDYES